MKAPLFTAKAPDFRAEKCAEEAVLLLLVSNNRIEGVAFNSLHLKPIAACAYTVEYTKVDQALTSSEILGNYYKKVEVLLLTTQYTFVPAALYRPSNQKKYLQLEYGNEVLSHLASDRIAEADIENVYAMPDELHHTLVKQYPNAHIQHAGTVQAKAGLKAYRHAEGTHLWCHIVGDTMLAFMVNDGTVNFQNHFAVSHADEVLFYTLSIVQQQHTDQADLHVHFSGTFTEENTFQNHCRTYLRHPHFTAKTSKNNGLLTSYQSDQRSFLLNAITCV